MDVRVEGTRAIEQEKQTCEYEKNVHVCGT